MVQNTVKGAIMKLIGTDELTLSEIDRVCDVDARRNYQNSSRVCITSLSWVICSNETVDSPIEALHVGSS